MMSWREEEKTFPFFLHDNAFTFSYIEHSLMLNQPPTVADNDLDFVFSKNFDLATS